MIPKKDRAYALELMIRLSSNSRQVEEFLPGNWCDSIIGNLLEIGFVEITEHCHPENARLGQVCARFYVVTEAGKDWLADASQTCWETAAVYAERVSYENF